MTHGYWSTVWKSYRKQPLGMVGAFMLAIFFLMAIWAPFLACSKPICVLYRGEWYFPLFRYLLSSLFFTKKIDIFFNAIGLFFLPFLATYFFRQKLRRVLQIVLGLLCFGCFVFFGFFYVVDPAISVRLNHEKQAAYIQQTGGRIESTKPRFRFELPSWPFELEYLNKYGKLNLILNQINIEEQHKSLSRLPQMEGRDPPTRFFYQQAQESEQIANLKKQLLEGKNRYIVNRKEEVALRKDFFKDPTVHTRLLELEEENQQYEELENRLDYILERRAWFQKEMEKVTFILMPLIRPYHWEQDVGGDQAFNVQLPFMELTRINRKDLVTALIFGSRISLLVGFGATFLACAIGIPLGLLAGFYGGALDIGLCRFVEVWEAMPAFFMLMLLVTLLQTKAVFIVILVIAVFSWTSPFRFVRAETFRQREMLYIDATRALGFSNWRILCMHVLPNSLIAVLALLPFDIMAAITREAGLAFLGLGEEQSCSWGVLMDEGRSAFPAESMLLWPPAIVLTILLVVLAFIGEALQSAADPKNRSLA